jgi:hypothetical protein
MSDDERATMADHVGYCTSELVAATVRFDAA